MSVEARARELFAGSLFPYIIGFALVTTLLLVLSVVLNVRQWADHRAYKKGEKDRLERAAALASVKTSAALARGAAGDNKKLVGELAAIVERGREVRVVYRKAANARPLGAACAPGKARMDAVNAGADP